MSTRSFPDWFPDGCPPETAIDASGDVYRIVAGTTLSPDDFRTHHEMGTALTAPACRRCGVSVFNSYEAALHRLRLSPRLGKAIAKGTLDMTSGKAESPNSTGHLEWWPYSDVDRPALFGEVKQCG